MTPEQLESASKATTLSLALDSMGIKGPVNGQLTTLLGPMCTLGTDASGRLALHCPDGKEPTDFIRGVLATPEYSIFAPMVPDPLRGARALLATMAAITPLSGNKLGIGGVGGPGGAIGL